MMANGSKQERQKATQKQKQKQKVSLFFGRGLLRDSKLYMRVVVAVVLAVSSAALSFTEFGFAGVGIDGDYSSYIVVLLQPIALAALLLGTIAGTLMGLFAGVVLYLHAIILPLDYYELAFVNAFSSVGMLGVAGFLLGGLFTFALRKNPSQVRRVIYIGIVCFVVSLVYSLAFVANVIATLVAYVIASGFAEYGADGLPATVQAEIASAALGIGDVGEQIFFDALIMWVLCSIGDYVARKIIANKGAFTLRVVFGTWLAVVVLIAFMITAAGSFVAVTYGSIVDEKKFLEGEVAYLCSQLEENVRQSNALEKFLEGAGVDVASLSDEHLDALIDSVSVDHLLDGYETEVDGTYVVSLGGAVIVSDDERLTFGTELGTYLSPSILDAIDTCLETDAMQRVIYDDRYDTERDVVSSDGRAHARLAYLYAKRTPALYAAPEDGTSGEGPDESSDSYYVVTAIAPAQLVFEGRSNVMQWATLSTFIILAVVFLLVSILLDKLVAQRIQETNGVLARVTEGDLGARVDVRDTQEFISLSDGINETVHALKGWIKEAETRMDAELATAKAIQESALPRIFPPYPDILRFDIYATMHPAKEVGGDFYDFFLLGDNCGAEAGKLGFVVADVSGKGVPAALFMMQAKTLIRDYLLNGVEIGEAIENANRQLCDGNDSGMFVTAWVGVLDYATGHVDYVNAGHNPPLLWQTNGWRWVDDKSGMPLGLFDGLPYTAYSVDCGIGDQFLLYTDGVTEAMSVEDELFGEDRLERLAVENYSLHPRELVEAVRRGVAQHASGAEQSDDITILALEVGVPPEITATLIVEADVDELSRVNEFIHTELDRRLCPLKAQHQLDIAVEELFVNVARYAYPDATPETPGMVRISYTYSADPPSISVDISDDGVPYDPLAKPDAVTPEDIEEVPIGGLGILMAKRSVSSMEYERIDGSNVVTIVKKW